LIQGGHTTLLVFVDEGVEVGLVSVGGGWGEEDVFGAGFVGILGIVFALLECFGGGGGSFRVELRV
jgi:hypothetical protein